MAGNSTVVLASTVQVLSAFMAAKGAAPAGGPRLADGDGHNSTLNASVASAVPTPTTAPTPIAGRS